MSYKLGWKGTTLLLCCYGLLKNFRPAVPFLTPYLVSPIKNFTDEQIYSQIYPFWTYSYLVALIPVFILTDLLKYKPIIILEALGLIGTWALLLWGVTVFQMQMMQIIFGIASAAEIAYYSYIYGVVDEEHYKAVTSYVRCFALVGKTIAYGSSQAIISLKIGSYLFLNYISFVSVSIILFIALLLPSVPKNHDKKDENVPPSIEEVAPLATSQNENQYFCLFPDNPGRFATIPCGSIFIEMVIMLIPFHFRWSLATCGMLQVGNYIQPLWALMQTENIQTVQNGVVECIAGLLGAGVSLLMQYINLNWNKYGELILGAISILDGILLLILARTAHIFLSFALYIIICTMYQMLITVATRNIACKFTSARCAMIFGCNTFVALILQAILTFTVVDKSGLALEIREQFFVYGFYHLFIGAIFIILIGINLVRKCCN